MRLTVGVGARHGVPPDELDALVSGALAEAGADPGAVVALATVDSKLGEPGIAEVAARRGWPLVGYPAAELAGEAVPNPSSAALAATGTPSVAEAAALRAARDGAGAAQLVVAKRASDVATVAVASARRRNPDHGLDAGDERLVAFWRERHLCTLTTLRADGTPHVVPVGATLDSSTATVRVIASRRSRKVRHVEAAGPAGAPVAVCQVDGRRWSTVEGRAVVRDDPDAVADAVRRYAERYRPPRPNPDRVVIEIRVTRILGNV
jgi:F420H(2)-dependent biliverdin reductase